MRMDEHKAVISALPDEVKARGRADGHRDGHSQGYRMGRCQAVLNQIPPESPFFRDISVLFVPEGFPAIDQGIVEAMQRMVRSFTTVGSTDDVVSVAASVKPDLLLVLNGIHNLSPDKSAAIRMLGIKTAVWFADDPYYTDQTEEIIKSYDYVFTHELSCVEFYKSLGAPEVHYLPLAVNPSLFRPMPVQESYQSDVCFIGTAFWNRVELFDRIAPHLAGRKVFISGALWDRMASYELLKDKIQLGIWVSPEETARYYNGAKIVINSHRSVDDEMHNRNSRKIPGLSINPRTYEMSACGTLQLTDIRHDLANFYRPGTEIAAYSSPEHLGEMLEYYLSHEEERSSMALKGLYRTRAEHTYHHRLTRLLETIFG